MKAVVYDQFGTADVLRLANVPQPEPRPGDLLVRVRALGVNRADILQRQGYYGTQTYGESALLGLELSGEVVAVGSDVVDMQPGDRVMAIVGGGAYAEYARVDRGMAVAIPEGLDFIGAAAVMESFVTAWEALVHLGEIAPGDSILVHAAAGGIGSAAVQIGKALGARVSAALTSSSTFWAVTISGAICAASGPVVGSCRSGCSAVRRIQGFPSDSCCTTISVS